MDTTQMSINSRMNESTEWFVHTMEYYSTTEEEWTTNTHGEMNMDESCRYNADWKEVDTRIK